MHFESVFWFNLQFFLHTICFAYLIALWAMGGYRALLPIGVHIFIDTLFYMDMLYNRWANLNKYLFFLTLEALRYQN